MPFGLTLSLEIPFRGVCNYISLWAHFIINTSLSCMVCVPTVKYSEALFRGLTGVRINGREFYLNAILEVLSRATPRAEFTYECHSQVRARSLMFAFHFALIWKLLWTVCRHVNSLVSDVIWWSLRKTCDAKGSGEEMDVMQKLDFGRVYFGALNDIFSSSSVFRDEGFEWELIIQKIHQFLREMKIICWKCFAVQKY